MYVCINASSPDFLDFLKCQTLRAGLLDSGMLRSAVTVAPEDSGYCFQRKTVIDCEKVFRIWQPQLGQTLQTTARLPENVLLLIDYKLNNPLNNCMLYAYDWTEVKRLTEQQ